MTAQYEKYCILVAEPNKAICIDLCDTLRELGHCPETVQSLDQLLRRLAGESLDALLLDTDICDDEIDALMTRVATVAPGLPVILIDSNPSVSSVRAALRCGAKDYLIKPFGLDELVGAIECACRMEPGKASSECYQRRRSAAATLPVHPGE